ncbi:response regulator transcription factor [uncultured Desulfobacter sp.]|uniref:response regulator transcription factor n=1 Tax=uncultured Desulfobacter sp. TaxID=240139 RepID=UPI002AABE43F|nr:response regulator transcription factor [uncultured Desulfobacter sp.]
MDSKIKRIVIAEDNTLLREGLCLMIESDPDLEVVAQAADGFSAIETTLSLKEPPDLVMMDLSMPKMDGVSAIKEIKRQRPDSRIMALTIHDSDEFILECFDAGASGYCLKDSSQDELLKAIHVVLSGKTYISPGIAGTVMEGFLDGRRKLKSKTAWGSLTQREREVLKLVAEGYTSKEMAGFLCISPKTVERHRSNIMNKLDLHNVSELTSFAIEKNLVGN